MPYTPLLFMGQEWAATTPFQFFTDHEPHLGRKITAGRREEFKGFAEFRDPVTREKIPDPQAESTFLRSKLLWEERRGEAHAATWRLYRELLRLRRTLPALQNRARTNWQVARLDDGLMQIDFGLTSSGSRVRVLVDLIGGPGRAVLPAVEWRLLLSTNEARFGGEASPASISPEVRVSSRRGGIDRRTRPAKMSALEDEDPFTRGTGRARKRDSRRWWSTGFDQWLLRSAACRHVRYLQQARELGDRLAVALNGDESVRSLKGPGRPINCAADRAEVLAALACVDFVTIFPAVRATEVILETRPAIYVKGGDYTAESLNAEERTALAEVDAKIEILSMVPGKSTSSIIERMSTPSP